MHNLTERKLDHARKLTTLSDLLCYSTREEFKLANGVASAIATCMKKLLQLHFWYVHVLCWWQLDPTPHRCSDVSTVQTMGDLVTLLPLFCIFPLNFILVIIQLLVEGQNGNLSEGLNRLPKSLETYKLWSNLFRPWYSNHAGSLSHNCTWNSYHRPDKCSNPM